GEVRQDKVASDKINSVDGIWNLPPRQPLDGIGRPAPAQLNLNPPQKLAADEDEVEAVTVSPGLGHSKTQADGLKQESQFGNFSAALDRKVGRRNERRHYR